MSMSRIKSIIEDAMSLGKFDGRNINQFINYLEHDDQIRWQIYREVERECHKADVLQAIEEYNDENDAEISFTDTELAHIVEQYEDYLGDLCEWRTSLNLAITPWIEEKINE